MDRKRILLDLRNEGKLKGLKPCFVSIKINNGKIYNGGGGTFIMTLKDGTFYFQKLSFFIHRLIPNEDFSVNAKRFYEYKLEKRTGFSIWYLYDKDGRYLPVIYQTGTPETFSTEDNVSRMIKELGEKYGLKLEDGSYGKEDSLTEGEGSDQEV